MTAPVGDAVTRAAVALASLGLGPGRLRRLVDGHGPEAAWELLRAGRHPDDPDGTLAVAAGALDVGRAVSRCTAAGVQVLVRGWGDYPASLADDEQAPAVLFTAGDPSLLRDRVRVAVVGTRSATTSGRETAFAMGEDLARAGCVVVSGLALGIDAAAHQGALAAGGSAAAVLGTGHDAAASPLQQTLRARVAETGVVLAELPPGAEGARWRFAVRNRIMAALAHVLVVVESHSEGGAMHTVRAARRRGIPVAAVPGSVRSRASAGTNELVVRGAPAVRDAADVLALLDRLPDTPPEARPAADPRRHRRPDRALPPDAAAVLDALEDHPRDLESVVLASGLSFPAVASALERLAGDGLAACEAGWWRRVGAG
ncbi:MAG: DNA-processing protein DprA [Acidimicrobiales bacterium]